MRLNAEELNDSSRHEVLLGPVVEQRPERVGVAVKCLDDNYGGGQHALVRRTVFGLGNERIGVPRRRLRLSWLSGGVTVIERWRCW